MAIENLGPLDWRIPIVTPEGRPTSEFQRRWKLQVENNGQIGEPADPTAIASDVAVIGTANTFMRSDSAPEIQKATDSQFGVVQVDGTTITETGGIISASGGGGSNRVFQSATPVNNGAVTGTPVVTHSYNVPPGLLTKVGDYLDVTFFSHWPASTSGAKAVAIDVGGSSTGGIAPTEGIARMWYQNTKILYATDTSYMIHDPGRNTASAALGTATVYTNSFMQIGQTINIITGSWSTGVIVGPRVTSNVVNNATVYFVTIDAYIA